MREGAPKPTGIASAAQRVPSGFVSRGATGHISNQFIRPHLVLGSSYYCAKYYDPQAFIELTKFSTDREQDFRPDFVASVLDGRQMTLANTDSIGKIRLCNVKPSHAPNPATDCSPVGCTRLRKCQRKG